MIGSLYGTLSTKRDRYIIVEVNGVGYKVFCGKDTLAHLKEGSEISIFTYLYVWETEISLYGFLAQEEVDLFELLLGISGIGPKSGLSILSLASPKDLKSAIVSGNDKLLTKVSGIGKKTAQKIILELKERLEEMAVEEGGVTSPEELSEKHDAIEALVALGYSSRQAREALTRVPAEVKNIEERVRDALKILGRK